MAFDARLAEKVSGALANIKNVEQKMMFSGIAFMVDDKMCVNVTSEGLMCRVGPKDHDTLIAKPGCSNMVMEGKELKGWILVSEEVIASKKELEYWISLCLSFNNQAMASKKKSKA